MARVKAEFALQMYETMLKIRAFENRVSKLFRDGKLPGFVHLYIGQEAVAAGTCQALGKDDYITSNHRGHGHAIAKGSNLKAMMAELFGKATGTCNGKGGSMHIFDAEVGNLGANGILAAGIPIAVGAALSAKVRGTQQVAVSFFGEGASCEGAFHEAVNMAAVLRLPVVFLCEANGYAELSPYHIHLNISSLTTRAKGYKIPGVRVDGNKVEEVYHAVSAAVERARQGEGPSLIEAVTLRWHGHYEGDPQIYRSQSEMEQLHLQDPLILYRQKLFDRGVLDEQRDRTLSERVDRLIAEAVQFAESSPLPNGEALLEDVYYLSSKDVV